MPKLVDHDERRSAFAQAAVEAIAARGVESLKLMDVGAAAGFTTGALTHYFRSRDDLLEAAFDRVAVQLFSGLEGSHRRLRISHFVETLPLDEARMQRWRVWLAFCGRIAYADRLAQVYDRYYARVERGIALRLGLEDSAVAQRLARPIIAAVDGVGLCATVQPALWRPDQQKAVLRSLLAPIFREIERRSKGRSI